MEEHSQDFPDLASRISESSGRVIALDQKVDRFRDELSSRIDALGQKVDRFRDELCSRIDDLNQKVSTQFVWLVGIQIAILLAVIGTLLGVVFS